MTEHWMVVDVDDVRDHAELEEEVGVRGVPPRDVEIRKAIREEEKPNKNDDHKTGQTAQGLDRGVKTRSKLK